jgi:hypothetical protein
MEKWKAIICDSPKCVSEMFVPENMKSSDNSLNERALQKYRILPDIDNTIMTQFTCPRCGKITTWGITRKETAQVLYERYNEG